MIRMFIPDTDLDFLPIPDPGVKKAPDPGSGSPTLSATCPGIHTGHPNPIPYAPSYNHFQGQPGCQPRFDPWRKPKKLTTPNADTSTATLTAFRRGRIFPLLRPMQQFWTSPDWSSVALYNKRRFSRANNLLWNKQALGGYFIHCHFYFIRLKNGIYDIIQSTNCSRFHIPFSAFRATFSSNYCKILRAE